MGMRTSRPGRPGANHGLSKGWLIAINAVQMVVIVAIGIMWRFDVAKMSIGVAPRAQEHLNCPPVATLPLHAGAAATSTVAEEQVNAPAPAKEQEKVCRGVAITFLLHSPKWFQRRYNVMTQNILVNIPSDWCVQIFHTGAGQSKNGIDINRGLQRMIQSKRITMTLIPGEVFNQKRRKIQLMTDPWVWENVLSERVLVFGGNQVICGNAVHPIEDVEYARFDYIGTSWHDRRGVGGDGGISLRSRTAMLAALQFRKDDGTSHNGKEREDVFFVRTLQDMQKEGKMVAFPGENGERVPRIANRGDTHKFGGVKYFLDNFNSTVKAKNTETIGPPTVASGTLPSLPYDVRDAFLTVCPELKMIFPSLHEPACFGAHPNAEGCKKSICALREIPRKGGC